MFHSPYCFLSKLTIQNPICKKVPIFYSPCCFLSKLTIQNTIRKKVPIFSLSLLFSFKNNYSEPYSQNRLYEASFSLQYLSNFHAD